MTDPFKHDAARAVADRDWWRRIAEIGEAAGNFQALGDDHAALFINAGPTLLVTFEQVDSIRLASPGQMPMGYQIAAREGWSHLCLIAKRETWYRDPAVYAYFDTMIDMAVLDEFEHVVFYGEGMGGYAACAFGLSAPGATIVAIRPQATLDPAVTEWDPRFKAYHRLAFNDRYGYAPDMVDGAGQTFILYDPDEHFDAMHAALFTRPSVTKLRCRHLGSKIEFALSEMGVLPQLLSAAGNRQLSARAFHRMFRARRSHLGYLTGLISRLRDDDRPLLGAYLCRSALRRLDAPQFRRRLDQIEIELAMRGARLKAPGQNRGPGKASS